MLVGHFDMTKILKGDRTEYVKNAKNMNILAGFKRRTRKSRMHT